MFPMSVSSKWPSPNHQLQHRPQPGEDYWRMQAMRTLNIGDFKGSTGSTRCRRTLSHSCCHSEFTRNRAKTKISMGTRTGGQSHSDAGQDGKEDAGHVQRHYVSPFDSNK